MARLLERLRADGYHVLHDIPEDGYNIDHVLVGPTGVFAIETKTVWKPTNRDPQIVYDGQTILVDGRTPDRDPIKQARAVADRVRQIIEERTGQRNSVRPVVVYPGWYVKQCCRKPHIWVLSANHLRAWLDHEPISLGEADVKRYASVLEDYVRGRTN